MSSLLLSLVFLSATLNDLYSFSRTSNIWTALSAASPPVARSDFGFVSTPDGILYVFGGSTGSGERGLYMVL